MVVGETHHFRKPPYMVNIEDDYSVFQNLGLMDFVIVDIFSKSSYSDLVSRYCLRTEFRGYQGDLRNPKSGLLWI